MTDDQAWESMPHNVHLMRGMRWLRTKDRGIVLQREFALKTSTGFLYGKWMDVPFVDEADLFHAETKG